MKSAYELAMERLAAKEGAPPPVSATTRQALAAADTRLRAKIAEREILCARDEAAARAGGEPEKARALREQFLRERAALEAEAERAKAKLRG